MVPDFTFDLQGLKIPPMIYWVKGHYERPGSAIYVKLSGRDLPETLDAIDGLWKRFGDPRPIRRLFLDQHLQEMYLSTLRQGMVMRGLAATAVIIAALGLFGLSAFTVEARTKEIGVRKALGATRVDILRLLLWQFTKSVLWANALAWPAAYLVMQRWLEGFAYHITFSAWMFAAASALALTIAVATVLGHVLLVARAQPVSALRYE